MCGVDSTKLQARRLHRDARFRVADFAEQNDVGSRNRSKRARKPNDLVVDLRLTPGI